jgi:hypothetical protein
MTASVTDKKSCTNQQLLSVTCADCKRSMAPHERVTWGQRYSDGAAHACPLCDACANAPRIIQGQKFYNAKRGNGYELCPTDPCENCGRPVQQAYVRSRRSRVYCCVACRYRLDLRRRHVLSRERICVTCGDTFKPRRGDAKTCSAACRQRAYRQRIRPPAGVAGG